MSNLLSKIKFNQFFLLAILAIFSLSSCGDDDDAVVVVEDNPTLFAEMQKALGGSDNIANASFLKYQSTGIAYEFQEDPEPIDGKVADFNYALIYNLDGTQSKQDWVVDAEYAYATYFEFEETIDGTNGKSTGETGTFPAHFQSFGVTGDPMYSTKIASRQKTLMMSAPLAMAKMIATSDIKGDTYGTINVGFNTSALGFGAATPDIELLIDTNTKLPIKAQVLENDPLLGDVVYEVLYSDWVTIGNIQIPLTLEHILDGNTIRTETFSNVEINPTFDASELTVAAADAYPYDANQAMFGHLSSQFHYRTLLQTFPIDFPVHFVDSEFGVPSTLIPDDPNAYLIAGDLQSHYTFAFKVDGGILLYDSPANDRRSEVVLDKVRSDFSTAPIHYVVHSHNHFDHTGGVRGNLAEGGELIVGSGSKSFIEGVLQRSSTVLPNPIDGMSITVVGVENSMTIGAGDEQIELYTIPSEHAEEDDYVVLYKPSTKTLYFNDLVNPGFVFVFDVFSAENQERIIRLAKDVVDFVDAQGLDVVTYYCTHGFTLQDFDFQTVRDLAAM